MKKNFYAKFFGLTLTVLLALPPLTACGNSAGTTALLQTSGQIACFQEGNSGSIDTVLLSMNPEIEMDDDDDWDDDRDDDWDNDRDDDNDWED